MLVAIAILAMSLAAMYQVAGGATRTVSVDEKMVYGVELARSLLAVNQVVPVEGLSETGETEGDFRWELRAEPIPLPDELPLSEGQLQRISVAVRWSDGDRERAVELESVVAGREERQ